MARMIRGAPPISEPPFCDHGDVCRDKISEAMHLTRQPTAIRQGLPTSKAAANLCAVLPKIN
jgi:hypothetical protein